MLEILKCDLGIHKDGMSVCIKILYLQILFYEITDSNYVIKYLTYLFLSSFH